MKTIIGRGTLFNASFTFHDNLQPALRIPESVWYGGLAFGATHAIAIGITYAAYCANFSPFLWQYHMPHFDK